MHISFCEPFSYTDAVLRTPARGIYKSPATALLCIKHSLESFIPRKLLILSLFMNQYHKDLRNEKEHSNFPGFEG